MQLDLQAFLLSLRLRSSEITDLKKQKKAWVAESPTELYLMDQS